MNAKEYLIGTTILIVLVVGVAFSTRYTDMIAYVMAGGYCSVWSSRIARAFVKRKCIYCGAYKQHPAGCKGA